MKLSFKIRHELGRLIKEERELRHIERRALAQVSGVSERYLEEFEESPYKVENWANYAKVLRVLDRDIQITLVKRKV